MVANDGRQSSSVLSTPSSFSSCVSLSSALLHLKLPLSLQKKTLGAHVQRGQKHPCSHLDTGHHSYSARHENRTCWFALNHSSLNLGPVSPSARSESRSSLFLDEMTRQELRGAVVELTMCCRSSLMIHFHSAVAHRLIFKSRKFSLELKCLLAVGLGSMEYSFFYVGR